MYPKDRSYQETIIILSDQFTLVFSDEQVDDEYIDESLHDV